MFFWLIMKRSQILHFNYPPEGLNDTWRVCRLEKIAKEVSLSGKLGGILLDIGCNDCSTSKFLGMHIFEYVGLDISKEALKRGTGRQRVLCDAYKLPIKDAAGDLAICAEVIEHVEDPDVLMGEISRVLKPKAKLFISTPNSEGLFSKLQDRSASKKLHNWCYFEYHVQICNPEIFDTLLEKHGFRTLRKLRSIALPPFRVTKKKRVFQIASFFSRMVPPDLQELLIRTAVKSN
jgi:SAM-dependent methyltransferase